MSEPFIAEITLVACNFAPRSWADCEGQLLPISNNTALFSLIGTTYGGDGKSTFALPDLRGRAAVQAGHGPGLSDWRLGESQGVSTTTLNTNQMPSHSHSAHASSDALQQKTPSGHMLGDINNFYSTEISSNMMGLNQAAVGQSGGSLPHENMQPYLSLRFIIALQGIFPSRS